MLGWVLVGIAAVPALGPMLLDTVGEAVHALWMRRHDPVTVSHAPLAATEPLVEVEGFAGMIVDGEVA